jgi:hypothetical protein
MGVGAAGIFPSTLSLAVANLDGRRVARRAQTRARF